MGSSRLGFNDLVAQVDQILFDVWDPIGVNEFPEARDEYTSYAPSIARDVLVGDQKQLLNTLHYIVTDSMGMLTSETSHGQAIAALLDLRSRYVHLIRT